MKHCREACTHPHHHTDGGEHERWVGVGGLGCWGWRKHWDHSTWRAVSSQGLCTVNYDPSHQYPKGFLSSLVTSQIFSFCREWPTSDTQTCPAVCRRSPAPCTPTTSPSWCGQSAPTRRTFTWMSRNRLTMEPWITLSEDLSSCRYEVSSGLQQNTCMNVHSWDISQTSTDKQFPAQKEGSCLTDMSAGVCNLLNILYMRMYSQYSQTCVLAPFEGNQVHLFLQKETEELCSCIDYQHALHVPFMITRCHPLD